MRSIKFTILLLLLFIHGTRLSGQNVDSLNNLLNTTNSPLLRAEIFREISKTFIQNEKYLLAETYQLYALDALHDFTDSEKYVEVLLTLTGIYNQQNLFNKSLEIATKAIIIARNQGYNELLGKLLINYAISLKETANYTKAKKAAEESVEVFGKIGDSLKISYAYNSLGMIEKKTGNYAAAYTYFEKSLEIRKRLGTPTERLIIMGNMANLMLEAGQFDAALELNQSVYKMAVEVDSRYFYGNVLFNIAETYLAKKDTATAMDYYSKSLDAAFQNGFAQLKMENLKKMADIFYAQNDIKKAWTFNKNYLAIKDSLAKLDQMNGFDEVQLLYDSQLNQSKIKELELKNARTIRIFHIIIISILLLMVFLIYLRSVKLNRAKNALKVSEKSFRMLAENAAEVIWSTDLNLNMTYISPSTEQLFGYPRDERLKMSLSDLFDDESMMRIKAELQRNLELYRKNRLKAEPIILELTGKHKDGHHLFVEITADFSLDENGKVKGLQGIARDITARKEADLKMLAYLEDLRKQDEELRLKNEELQEARHQVEKTAHQYYDLFENGPLGYLILDEHGVIEELNSTSVKMLGKGKEKILGTNFSLFLDEPGRVKFSEILENTFRLKSIQEHELKVSSSVAKVVFVPEFSSDTKKCRVALVDLYNEIEVREKLSLALRSMQTVFEAIPGGVSVIDKNHNIINLNNRLLQIHNLNNRAAVVGKKCFEAYRCKDNVCENCRLKEVMEKRKTLVRISSPNDLVYKGIYRIYSSPIFDENDEVTGMIEIVMDISDLKKAEIALAQSEKKFEDLFNDIPDAVFITKIGKESGKIVDVNAAAEKQTGYTRGELIGLNVLRDISMNEIGGDLTTSRENNLLIDKKIEILEQKRRKDGSIIWTEVVVQKISINGEDFALSVSRDVTDRKQTEENLIKSESRVSNLLNVIPDIFFVINSDGVILEFHTDTNDKLYLPPEEFINKTLDEVLPAELAELSKQKIIETLETGKMQVYEYSILINGKTTYQEARMLKSSEDTVVSIVRDYTSGKLHEIERRKNEEKYKTIFLNAPVGVFNFDQNGVILDCNDNFIHIIGSTRDALVGFNMLRDLKDTQMKEALKKAINEGSGYYHGNYQSITAKKSTPVNVFLKSIYDSNKHFIDGIGIVEDITEQKNYEEKMVAERKRAEESDKLKSAFMATMSHELRTPLNTVIGFSDMIEEGIPIDQILEFTHVISKSGKHLLSIIEDILDISLIESGEVKISIQRFSLRELIDGLYATISQEKVSMNKDHLEVKVVIPESLMDQRLSGDLFKIHKIFGHLIKNAIKFTKQGNVEVGAKAQNASGGKGKLLFYVKDTGTGVPKDKHEIIFEIFRQADDSTTREFEGTGLGLSISKKLIEMMGGSIWLESEVGKGSTFFFELPCMVNASDAIDIINKYRKPEVKVIKSVTVLVAEDDDTNFHLFKLLLNRKNLDVIRARNGQEAIELMEKNKEVKLVLMDINMPLMNGYDATRKIKEINFDLPVIAVTAYAMAGDKAKAYEAGCDDYITKPINNLIFYETISKYL